jgi:hypothetical protein
MRYSNVKCRLIVLQRGGLKAIFALRLLAGEDDVAVRLAVLENRRG